MKVSNGESNGAGSTRVLLISLYGGILGFALLARFVWLDSLPDVDGDEAWYGLWVKGLLRDQVWGGKTPAGNFPNPFFLVERL